MFADQDTVKAQRQEPRKEPAGPVKMTPSQELAENLRSLIPGVEGPPKVSSDELVIFTRQLAAMLSSGIPLHNALEFHADADEGDLSRVMEDVAYKVATGHTFSRAMRHYPRIFNSVYIGLAETGEQSGQITTTFERLADMLEKQADMRKKVISTVTYPIVLFVVSTIAVAGFVYFVLPLMVPLFENLGVELPLPTRILLMARTLMPLAFLLAFVGIIGQWLGKPWLRRYFQENKAVQMRLHNIPLNLPVVGTIYSKLVTARVLYSMATMLDAGLTMVQVIRRSATVAGNAVVEARLERANKEIIDGSTIFEAMSIHRVFPPSALQMLSVGEESADLTGMIRHVADFYDSEVEIALADFAAIIEPLIMIIMGIIVGFIVLSAVLPTVQLLQQL